MLIKSRLNLKEGENCDDIRILLCAYTGKAAFNIGGSTTSTRSWTIRVTQYTCAELDSSGPPGCLQYYTQTANTIEK